MLSQVVVGARGELFSYVFKVEIQAILFQCHTIKVFEIWMSLAPRYFSCREIHQKLGAETVLSIKLATNQ